MPLCEGTVTCVCVCVLVWGFTLSHDVTYGDDLFWDEVCIPVTPPPQAMWVSVPLQRRWLYDDVILQSGESCLGTLLKGSGCVAVSVSVS